MLQSIPDIQDSKKGPPKLERALQTHLEHEIQIEGPCINGLNLD